MGNHFTVNCPSGLSGEVRPFKTKEANLLANPRQGKNAAALDQVMKGCWEQTLDPGPYEITESGPNWSRALVADRFETLIGIRIATYGADYEFQVNCASCKKRFWWGIDLINDLQRKRVPDESLSAFLADNRFEAEAAGKRVWFKLLVGADEARNNARFAQSRDQMMTVALAARIVEVEGVEGNDKMRWLSELDMGDTMKLLDRFDEVDGGVETEIEVQCAHCDTVQDIELPFGREFFLPRRRKVT